MFPFYICMYVFLKGFVPNSPSANIPYVCMYVRTHKSRPQIKSPRQKQIPPSTGPRHLNIHPLFP